MEEPKNKNNQHSSVVHACLTHVQCKQGSGFDPQHHQKEKGHSLCQISRHKADYSTVAGTRIDEKNKEKKRDIHKYT
jgi:hypothetical protein